MAQDSPARGRYEKRKYKVSTVQQAQQHYYNTVQLGAAAAPLCLLRCKICSALAPTIMEVIVQPTYPIIIVALLPSREPQQELILRAGYAVPTLPVLFSP